MIELSVCIPIYQVDVTTLVYTLVEQAQYLDCSWEILCVDDGSDPEIRRRNAQVLTSLSGVRYVALDHNQGRSKIRNWLGAHAKGRHLLFIDADSSISKADYLATYAAELPADAIYGGRTYRSVAPVDEYALHWRYGRQYEDRPVQDRQQSPAHTFLTCNCLVAATVHRQIVFDENIEGYGYEDLAFAEAILQKGFTIKHIDNSIIHEQLDDNHAFLKKSRAAISNLAQLYKAGQLSPTRLIKVAQRLQRWRLDGWAKRWIRLRQASWLSALRKGRGQLWQLQLLKLLWWWELE